MLRNLTKLYWGSGFGGWRRRVKDCGDRFLFLNISWVMMAGVCQANCLKLMGFGTQLFTSGFWNSIISVKDDVVPWIRFRVHDGCRVRFWHDKWCGQSMLLNLFAENLLIISGRVM